MSSARAKNTVVLAGAGAMMAVMFGLVSYAPTLYRMFCSLTGYGGTVRRAAAPSPAKAADATQAVTVYFDANVDPGLPWSFRPEQRKVVTHVGQPTKVYYWAKNESDKTIVARATYDVTPYKAAPYFFKIECFCFTDEKLAPGQSARMPLVLYLDEQMLKDPNTAEIHQVTLSYTFFRQTDLSKKDVAAARDLKAGSEAKDADLKQSETAGFDNDAPRQ